MRILTHTAPSMAMLVAAFAFGGVAQAQLVTVDMKNVTIQEVAKELERQTDLQFRITGGRKPLEWLIGARVAEVKGKDRPAKDVLREACEATGYKFRRINRSTFWIEVGEIPPRPYASRIGAYEVVVQRVTVAGERRSLDFSMGVGGESLTPPRLSVELLLEADTDEDGERVAAFGDIFVIDSEGKEASAPARENDNLRMSPAPDSVKKTISFDLPSPGATEIATLEGSLRIREAIDRAEMRFDDITRANVTQTRDDITVTLLDVKGPEPAGRGKRSWSARVETTGLSSNSSDTDVWRQEGIRLVGDDGKDYSAQSTSGSGRNNTMTWELSYRMIPEDVNVVALAVKLIRTSSKTREEEFIIRNIPLPE